MTQTSTRLARQFLAATALMCFVAPAGAQDSAIKWSMQSWFPSNLPQAGTLGKEIERKIEAVSGGNFQIQFFEPGALMPPAECFDAVSAGAIEACWTIAAYWQGRNPAFSIFAATPFGPQWPELLGWFYDGGGKELYEPLYNQFNIHGMPCGGMSPEAAGWFNKEINTAEDFAGLKMRIPGLGAAALDKAGASTQLLAAGDIYPALELGTIDATEFATPSADRVLGFHEVAANYYFPGWHQPATFYELIINLDSWNGLSDTQKVQLEMVCGDNVRQAIVEGESRQSDALAFFDEQGVNVARLPEEVLEALNNHWLAVVEEYSAQSPEFAAAWESLETFRAKHKRWSDLQETHSLEFLND
ncbi:MAG: TRAP transporter substrate-binding protein [Aurantimonas endophytica]|uniref:TRAP-type mannitol/chloroaromatic compound transport system substrate-binding protein n=1 Tax=Aurantimonas endophytica TaxID=1522175 RepID=A0A7W6HFY6_9HYPH|nr:TRAP transporter substrate-binding protein [Aurantimonas endophytica]MBB4004433.1 TRAP-type mannitol/chloroaromatic compound transport system substrate-binding protein [Aurantimonas endophytica]MCO6405271.1 C4-dicarboxylate ABC transporter [Aurantimonas endophytica]